MKILKFSLFLLRKDLEIANGGGGGATFNMEICPLQRQSMMFYKHTVHNKDLNLSLKMSFHSELEKEIMIFYLHAFSL